jgi:hypothetical protein
MDGGDVEEAKRMHIRLSFEWSRMTGMEQEEQTVETTAKTRELHR